MFPSLYADLDSSMSDSYAIILLKLTRTYGMPLRLVAAYYSWHLLSALVLHRYHLLTCCNLRFPDFGEIFDQCFPAVIHSLIALSDSVSNGPFIVTSCPLKCIVYFVTKKLYFVLLLTENKKENKEVGSQMKQCWLVTHTRLTSPNMSLISWHQASQPKQPDQPDGTWWRWRVQHMFR